MHEQRTFKTDNGEYQFAEWSGENESGFKPIGERVIVLPDYVDPKTKGGILLTDEKVWATQEAAITGVIVAMGAEAYTRNEHGQEWLGDKPKIGDRVYFEKYAGSIVRGKDSKRYRLMSPSCIGAVGAE